LTSLPNLKKPLSVYIHIPFCQRKCSYCTFISSTPTTNQIDNYINALIAEITSASTKTTNHIVKTIYIGGGTPSILENHHLTKIFDALKSTFQIDNGAEVTIECNPSSTTPTQLKHWLSLGINRLSIGIQSFNDETLKTLGRNHSVAQAIKCIQTAHNAGFRNISIDLIHSIPTTNNSPSGRKGGKCVALDGVVHDVFSLIAHISLYSLQLEPNTPLHARVQSGELTMPTEDQSIAQQLTLEKLLQSHGFKKYEVSNFSKPNFQSRHNSVYWDPSLEYLGFGVSAHSLFNNTRIANTEDINLYLNSSQSFTLLQRSHHDLITEHIMLGLRTTRGANITALSTLGFDILSQRAQILSDMKRHKLIKVSKTHISATQKGFLILNQIVDKLT
jgi:oxygen-independent coproporphyrinogen-3 oxidase